MSKTTLQIPIDSTLRDKAALVATDLGFSSLQEAVRVYLKQLSDRRIGISLVHEPEAEYLTPEQVVKLDKTAAQVDRDIEKGDYFVATTHEEMIKHLRSL